MSRNTLIKNDHLHLEMEINEENIPLLHCEVYKWSRDLYWMYLDWFDEVRMQLRSKGLTELFVAIPNGQKGTSKFAQMFGFKIKYKNDTHYIGVRSI